jgi:hypothetical protein
MAAQHLPEGAEALEPLQIETALRQQGLGLLAADLAILERLADGALHSVQRPQCLLARLLEVFRQHGQGIRQHPIGESVVGLAAKEVIVAGEPLLEALRSAERGQGILQFELGIEQALLVQRLASLPALCTSFSSQRRDPLMLALAAP